MDPVTLAALIGGGTSVLGGVMGNNAARNSSRQQQQMADTMARAQRMQEDVYRGTEARAQPFRDILYPQLQDILGGKTDLSSSPMYSNARVPLEQQYSQARRALESRVGPSGARGRAAGQLEAGRASAVGQIPGRLYQSYMDTGLGLAAGRPDLGVQAFGQQASQAGDMFGRFQTGIDQGNELMGQSGMQLGNTLYNTFLHGPPDTAGGGSSNLFTTPGAGRYDPGLAGGQYNLRTAYGGR